LESGFGSSLSGFDFTMVVLLFLLYPPGASPWKVWEIVEQALKKKAIWRFLKSKNGRIHPASCPGIPDRSLQKLSTRVDADAVLFCSRMAERPFA
jgi:hypothetical protein